MKVTEIRISYWHKSSCANLRRLGEPKVLIFLVEDCEDYEETEGSITIKCKAVKRGNKYLSEDVFHPGLSDSILEGNVSVKWIDNQTFKVWWNPSDAVYEYKVSYS